ncbi:peptidase domain-containing ABC transporter [Magnetococcales bacterium HHB-1]
MHTSLQCLVLAARQHGLDLSVERLQHDYSLGGDSDAPTTTQLIEIAENYQFKAKSLNVSWSSLVQMDEAFPVLAFLENGNTVLVVGVDKERKERDQIFVMDPLSERPEVLRIDRERMTRVWHGQILLLKRRFKLRDIEQPFGFRWFIAEILRQKTILWTIATMAFALHILSFALPIFIQVVLDKVLSNQAYSTLYVLTTGVVLALVFNALLTFFRSLLLLHAARRIDIRISSRVYARLLALPIHFFTTHATGSLNKHVQQSGTIREFLSGRLFLAFLDATALLVLVPVLFFYSAEMTWTVLGFTGLIALNMLLSAGPYRRRLGDQYEAEGKQQSILVESISNMETIKALALEPQQNKNWRRIAAQTVQTHFEVGRIGAMTGQISALLQQLMMVSVIFIGVHLFFAGGVTAGALIAFNMLAARVTGPLVQLVSLVRDFQQIRLSVEMLGHVMNQRPEQKGRGLTPPLAGEIQFEKVGFQYKDSPWIVQDISFHVRPGQTIGLVGRSGSGKSTITRLLQGMMFAQRGVIRIDGFDIRQLDLAWLRTHTSVVLQSSALFRGTVRENIARSKPDASLEEIASAAQMAGALEFIERLPKGFDTALEEGGNNLSGGQRQRLAIARALLRRPKLLILDEATSALDPESDYQFQRALDDIKQKRTLIIVSHRLAQVMRADQILVVDQGKIVGAGPHKQLLKSCALYAQLWQQQHEHLISAKEKQPLQVHHTPREQRTQPGRS